MLFLFPGFQDPQGAVCFDNITIENVSGKEILSITTDNKKSVTTSVLASFKLPSDLYLVTCRMEGSCDFKGGSLSPLVTTLFGFLCPKVCCK